MLINVTMKPKATLSRYEELIFTISFNVIQKLMAAAILYESKLAYPSSYFLAVIAEEELAKLILIPILNETGQLNKIKKGDSFFHHKSKQKIICSYGYFKKNWEKIEETKQGCLYTGIAKGEHACTISEQQCYKEIKDAVWSFQYQMKCIASEKTLSEDLKKILLQISKWLGGCLQEKIPSLGKESWEEMNKEVGKLKKNKKKAENAFLESLFKNPYELIRISKAALGKDYKAFLSKIQNKTFEEMISLMKKEMGLAD